MNNLNVNESILFKKFEITSADTDMYKRLRLGSLVNFIIQSAISSADSLGFGFGDLKEQQLFWVLSRLTVNIYRPLNWEESIIIETWPKDIKGILFLRDFIIRDIKNNIMAKATSGWLAIDMESKRPARIIDSVNSHKFTDLKDKHGIKENPVKLKAVNSEDFFDVKSTYYDLDFNKHVTSTRYIDWMMDSFSLEYHAYNYPKKLSINYIRETKPEEKISIKKETISNKIFLFEGTNINKSMISFRGEIEF